MTRTLQLRTFIPESREVVIHVPKDFPSGDAQLIVKITSGLPPRQCTLRDLERSEFFGMWRNREDKHFGQIDDLDVKAPYERRS